MHKKPDETDFSCTSQNERNYCYDEPGIEGERGEDGKTGGAAGKPGAVHLFVFIFLKLSNKN